MSADVQSYPIRPFMPADTMALRDLFAQSIEELTAEDYTEDQRLAWIARAEDAEAFADRLEAMVTFIVQVDGLRVSQGQHRPGHALCAPVRNSPRCGNCACRCAREAGAARGAEKITVEASDTAQPFFARRGYVPGQRNLIPIEDEWLSNTTMSKPLADKPASTGLAGKTRQ